MASACVGLFTMGDLKLLTLEITQQRCLSTQRHTTVSREGVRRTLDL